MHCALACIPPPPTHSLCEPYVTHKLLRDVFGNMAEEVASLYFVDGHPPRLRFREPFTREADIAAIAPRPDAPPWMVEETQLKRQGLLMLRRNVVLLRDPEDQDKFYPVRALGGGDCVCC